MELTASYLTLAGARFGEPTRHGILARAHAAASAGYGSIGAAVCEVTPAADLGFIAAQLPVPVHELEWYDLGAPDPADATLLLRMADAFKANRVNVGVCSSTPYTSRRVVSELRRFADRAGEHSLMVAVEPVAFGSLWHPHEVLDIIHAADMPNVGLLYDTWQLWRAHCRDLDCDITVPGYAVAEVQLAGIGEVTDDCFGDAQDRRSMPDAEASAALQRLRGSGFTGPVSVEVASAAVRSLACTSIAEVTLAACAAILPQAA